MAKIPSGRRARRVLSTESPYSNSGLRSPDPSLTPKSTASVSQPLSGSKRKQTLLTLSALSTPVVPGTDRGQGTPRKYTKKLKKSSIADSATKKGKIRTLNSDGDSTDDWAAKLTVSTTPKKSKRIKSPYRVTIKSPSVHGSTIQSPLIYKSAAEAFFNGKLDADAADTSRCTPSIKDKQLFDKSKEMSEVWKSYCFLVQIG